MQITCNRDFLRFTNFLVQLTRLIFRIDYNVNKYSNEDSRLREIQSHSCGPLGEISTYRIVTNFKSSIGSVQFYVGL